jgi:hypothetical protein
MQGMINSCLVDVRYEFARSPVSNRSFKERSGSESRNSVHCSDEGASFHATKGDSCGGLRIDGVHYIEIIEDASQCVIVAKLKPICPERQVRKRIPNHSQILTYSLLCDSRSPPAEDSRSDLLLRKESCKVVAIGPDSPDKIWRVLM